VHHVVMHDVMAMMVAHRMGRHAAGRQRKSDSGGERQGDEFQG